MMETKKSPHSQSCLRINLQVVRNSLKWVTLIGILCSVRATSERWSRQIANSEWVPLADPRNGQTDRGSISVAAPSAAIATDTGFQASGRVPAVALPPVLQQQYQDQLLKLHKTHESIQRLLALQQQLKAQQQLLRSHAYEPNGFPNSEDEKQALHQSTIVNLQTFPQLAPEVLVPPVPSSHALPPAFQAQDFRSSNSELRFDDRNHQVPPKLKANVGPNFGQIHEGSIIEENVEIDSRPKQKKWFETALKQQEEPTHINFVTPGAVQLDNGQEQEVQLVYVPAETLAQRAQTKLQRPKDTQLPPQYKNDKETASDHLNPQDAYAREILHHLQKQHEEKNQNLNPERQREVDRLNTEQRELESRARLQQELARREQELMRQRGAEKKKKEVERMEENARQLELQKMREALEKEEMRRQEAERIANLIKDREVKTRFESVNGHGLRGFQSQTYEAQHPQAQPVVREQQTYHQHLTEVTQKDPQSFRASSKQENQSHQFQQQGYQQGGVNPHQTLPPPNQPPLSVYMGDSASDQSGIKLADVLTLLRNARTIAVLDTFGPDSPRVFVGPRDLDTPPGYAKFDLPYLSSIENNRVGRRVDKVPFFVAPLSFEPPPGYSKIPFPAPHIGSVVINAAGNIDPQLVDAQDPSPTPLIEPNSYLMGNQQLSGYSNTPIPYAPTTSSLSYDVTSPVTSKPPSNKWRSDSFGGAKPSTESPTLPTVTPYQDLQSTMAKFDPPFKSKSYYSLNEVSTTPSYYSPKTVTTFSFEQMPPHSTPSYHDAQSTRVQDLHSIGQDERRQPVVNAYRKNGAYQRNQRYPANPASQGVTNSYYVDPAHVFEDQTQYNLPAELPAISPQLPGLVNALVEKNDGSSSSQPLTALPMTTPLPTITTTTTETPTTTHRPRTRQRGRVTASRPTTTQTPGSRDHSERARKPFNRSRSKYSTTTQDYGDSSYDPTRKNYATTSRYQGSGKRRNFRGIDIERWPCDDIAEDKFYSPIKHESQGEYRMVCTTTCQ
ncbi:hypothetical protein QAD02_014228 [Eretmocerus hayati]|uniref:Uncharacterized protein n=1 Tax=Eretmocerus hayati TaxID=131215 RepID=A0ACC2P4S0_9HYME|nr:hypothetical protein QAD02_014228 [Eretmocerus hayati]